MNRASRAWLASALAFVAAWAAIDAWLYLARGGLATISTGMGAAPPLVAFVVGYLAGGLTWGLAFHYWSVPTPPESAPMAKPKPHPHHPEHGPDPVSIAITLKLHAAPVAAGAPGAQHGLLSGLTALGSAALSIPAVRTFLASAEQSAIAALVAYIQELQGAGHAPGGGA